MLQEIWFSLQLSNFILNYPDDVRIQISKKMATLHNRVSRKELKERIVKDNTRRTTISFYCYFHIEEPIPFRNKLYADLKQIGVLGRIYLASEGINAQISVPTENVENFRNY